MFWKSSTRNYASRALQSYAHLPENNVPGLVSFPRFHQSKVAGDGILHYVVPAIELFYLRTMRNSKQLLEMHSRWHKKKDYCQSNTDLSFLTGDGNAAILVVFDRWPSFLDQRTVAGGGKKGRDSCTARPNPLCQCTLPVGGRQTDEKTHRQNIHRTFFLNQQQVESCC